VTRPRPPEHPLLGIPRRDAITTCALSLATAVLFVLIAFSGPRGAIQRVDNRWLRLMLDVRSGPLTAIAKVFNVLGLVYVIWPVRLVVAGFLALRRRWWHFAAFLSAVVLSEAAIGTLKSVYDRARPPHPLVGTSGGSFPSGHAVAASATAVAIVIALFPEGPRRYWWGAVAVAFSLLMGLSRTYLAAHWLSDSVGGILLGTSIALGTAVLVHLVREQREGRARGTPGEGMKGAIAAETAG
jgi:membrane-associated phospholipid phosphatase